MKYKKTIKYATYNGLVNALSTLEQLLPDLILGKEYARLSTGVIYDSPKYSYRGLLISYCHNFYFDYPYGKTSLKKTYSFSGKLIGLKPQYEKNVLGMEAAMWSEWMKDIKKFEFMLYPRMQAFAENCWCEKLDTY